MPHPFFFYEAMRRRLLRHQDRPRRSRVPMWRLLWWEVRYGSRWLFERPRVLIWAPALVVSILVIIGLDRRTPGPVLDVEWRMPLAVLVALVVGYLASAARSRTQR